MDIKQRENWLGAYRAVFQRANRIVTVSLQSGWNLGETPGWTDGTNINLNRDVMDKQLERGATRDLLLAIKGVNYHEVGHVLFTPRSGSKVAKTAKAEGQWTAFNILEDYRAETLFVATFTTARMYFTHAVSKYILDNPTQLTTAYLFLAGRKYLPKEMVTPIRELFAVSTSGMFFQGQPVVEALDSLADEYLRIVYPKDAQKAIAIIDDFHKLMQLIAPTAQSNCGNEAVGEGMPKGRSLSQSEQQNAQENLEIAEEDWEDEEQDDEESDEDEDLPSTGKASNTSSDADVDSEDDEDESGNADAPIVTEETEPDASESEADGERGAGVGDPNADIEAILDDLKDLMDDIATSSDVDEDLKDTQDAVQAELNTQVESVAGTRATSQKTSPTMEDLTARAKVIKHLRDITAELSPRWNHRLSDGYVDVDEVIANSHNPANLDVFTQWDSGREDEAECEIVILLDQSTSMRGQAIQDASRMLWTLRDAMLKVGIRVTALGFSDGWTKLYDPSERTSEVRQFGVYGGTQPLFALKESLPVFARSKAHNLILVIITDGGWGDSSAHEAAYSEMDGMNVTRMLVRIGDPWRGMEQFKMYGDEPRHRHGCHVVENVTSPLHITKAVEKLVGHIMVDAGRA